MSTYALALELRDTIAAQLDTSPRRLVATIDPAEAGAALDGDTIAVLIQPPRTEHTTVAIGEHTFEVLTIGPVLDPVQAWPLLDPVAEQLAELLEADSTRFERFQPSHGDPWLCAVTTTILTTT